VAELLHEGFANSADLDQQLATVSGAGIELVPLVYASEGTRLAPLPLCAARQLGASLKMTMRPN